MIYIWQNNKKRAEFTDLKYTNYTFDIYSFEESWSIKTLILKVKK